MNNEVIDIKNGRVNGKGILILSGLIITISMFAIIKSLILLYLDKVKYGDEIINLVLGIVFILIFTTPFIFLKGIKFDLIEKRLKVYKEIYGYKFGDWFSLEKYNSLSIIQSRKSGRVGRATTIGVSYISFNLVIMDSTHRDKLILKKFDSFDEAKEAAKILSTKTKIPLVKYAPKRLKNSKYK